MTTGVLETTIPDQILDVAKRLGVHVADELGMGDDGTAYLLDDGRVLRKTSSDQEVAIALTLQELASNGITHPAFPIVHGVWWFDSEFESNGQVFQYRPRVLIREEMPDVPVTGVFNCEEAVWKNALQCLSYGWAHDKPEYVEFALKKDLNFERLHEALLWAKESMGVQIFDLARVSNLGMLGSQVGIRDFSRAAVPDALLERVKRCEFNELPSASPAPVKKSSVVPV